MPKKINGNVYYTVPERINEFRTNEKYDGFSMTTEILEHIEGFVMMKATICNPEGRAIADGIAYEVNEAQGNNSINLTSYIENCQTSAFGRALAALGILSDISVASAEEVENAVSRQSSGNGGRGYTTPQNTQSEQPEKTPADFEEKWYSGTGPVNQFELFMIGDETYKCMKKKSDGTFFGLNINENCDPSLKFYSF